MMQLVDYVPNLCSDDEPQLNMSYLSYNDFRKICRTCLALTHLNAISDMTYEQTEVADLLEMCASIKVQYEEDLPQNICSECLIELIRAYTFKVKCMQSEKYIRRIKEAYFHKLEQKTEMVEHLNETVRYEKLLGHQDKIYEKLKRIPQNEEQMPENHETISENLQRISENLQIEPSSFEGTATRRVKLTEQRRESKHNLRKIEKRKRPFHLTADANKEAVNTFFVQCKSISGDEENMISKENIDDIVKNVNNIKKKSSWKGNVGKNNIIADEENEENTYDTTYQGDDYKEDLYDSPCEEDYSEENPCEEDPSEEVSSTKDHCEENPSKEDTYKRDDRCSITDSKREREKQTIRSKCKKKVKRKRVIAEVPPFKCRGCSETFDSKDGLKEHRKLMKHPEHRNHPCPQCGKTFTSSKLNQHMRTHTKEKPHKCNICSQAFSMRGNLKRHMMTHTGERPHVCEICGKGFIQATTLTNHMKTHAKHELLSTEPDAPRFFCSDCGRSFKRLARFNQHQVKHHSGGKAYMKTSAAEEGNPPEYICEICKRAYKTKHLLKSHQLTHGEKTFLCSECGKGFVTKAALQSHLKVHTGEKPHTCKVCQKSFAHVGSFGAHILIHSGVRPFSCKTCQKTFTQLSHLKYHLRTHSGEKPYVCSYCNKRFALKGNLTVHIRIHTGETPYLCPVCGKGFYDSSSMKKHRKGHGDRRIKIDVEPIEIDGADNYFSL